MEQSKTTKIYHYTDFNALQGILKNKVLWLNNIFCCNDRQEIKYYIKEIKQLISKELGNDEIGIEKQIVLSDLYSNYINQLDKLPVYATCFSTNGNDAAQWDRYSKNNTGVCIEFNQENLIKILPIGFYLEKIKYGLEDRDKNFVASVVDFLRNNCIDDNINFLKQSFVLLRESGCLYKHPSFVSESEYRLFTTHDKWVNNDFTSICYSFLNNNLIEYCKLEIGKICYENSIEFQDIVTGISLGANAKTSVEILSRYLKTLKLNKLAQNIIQTDCPLR